jgi:hypothetical protein
MQDPTKSETATPATESLSFVRTLLLPLKVGMKKITNVLETMARDGYLPINVCVVNTSDGEVFFFVILALTQLQSADDPATVEKAEVVELPKPEIIPAAKPDNDKPAAESA